MAQLTPIERRIEIEKLRLSKAKEGINLRHLTQNIFVPQLLRFGGQNVIQIVIIIPQQFKKIVNQQKHNQINQRMQNQMKRILKNNNIIVGIGQQISGNQIFNMKLKLIEKFNIKNIKQKYEKQVNKKLANQDLRNCNQILMNYYNKIWFRMRMKYENLINYLNKMKTHQLTRKQKIQKKNYFLTYKYKKVGDLGLDLEQMKGNHQLGNGCCKIKLKKIRKFQKMRQDAELDNIIISEKRDTKFSQYLVPKLPKEFTNLEQSINYILYLQVQN